MKRKSWPPYVVALLSFLIINIVVGIGMSGLLLWMDGDRARPLAERVARLAELAATPKALVVSVALTGVLFVAIAAFVTVRGRTDVRATLERRLGLYAFDPREAFAASLGVLGTSMVLDTIVQLVGLGGQGTLGAIHTALVQLPEPTLLAAAVVVGVFPGIGEEVFFRGYVMRRIQAADGALIAWIASSLMFGIFHFDPIHTPTSALIGFYLGWMVLRTGSLWVGVVAHTVNNFVATISVGRHFPDEHAPALFAVGLAAAASGIWYVRERRRAHVPHAW